MLGEPNRNGKGKSLENRLLHFTADVSSGTGGFEQGHRPWMTGVAGSGKRLSKQQSQRIHHEISTISTIIYRVPLKLLTIGDFLSFFLFFINVMVPHWIS